MASVERMSEYADELKQETARALQDDAKLSSAGWPNRGPDIVFGTVFYQLSLTCHTCTLACR